MYNMYKKLIASIGSLVLVFLLSAPAGATPVGFSSEAAWLTALGDSPDIWVEDFESSPVGNWSPGPTDIGLFSVESNAFDSFNAIVSSGFVNGSIELQAFISLGSTTFVDFTFEQPLDGFAGDWFSTTTGNLLVVTVNGGSFEFDNFLSGAGTGFFGVVDLMSSITSIRYTVETLTSFGEFWAVDNFQLAKTIPEPSTFALIAIGLVGLGFMARRRRKPVRD